MGPGNGRSSLSRWDGVYGVGLEFGFIAQAVFPLLCQLRKVVGEQVCGSEGEHAVAVRWYRFLSMTLMHPSSAVVKLNVHYTIAFSEVKVHP